jgi:pyridoxine 4-dehydrogenase
MVIIPGTANPDHLRANVAADDVAADLTDAEVARLTGLVDESTAALDRPDQSTVDALSSVGRAR